MANTGKSIPKVTSLSMLLKKAGEAQNDIDEIKKTHRANLKTLVDDYMSSVMTGDVEGIRNAKDLVEVIKMDLLLIGEATERPENIDAATQARMRKVSGAIDMEDPAVKSLLETVMDALNDANDEDDINPIITATIKDESIPDYNIDVIEDEE